MKTDQFIPKWERKHINQIQRVARSANIKIAKADCISFWIWLHHNKIDFIKTRKSNDIIASLLFGFDSVVFSRKEFPLDDED